MVFENADLLNEIRDIVEKQKQWRGHETLNLIASENIMSNTAEMLVSNDFAHRYAEGLIGNRAYQGQKYHDKIEKLVNDLALRLFKADFIDSRLPSATIANLAVFYAMLKPGELYYSLPLPFGAHISFRKYGAAGCRQLLVKDIPYNPDNYNIDVEKFQEIILDKKPKLITVGGSVYLFPHPIKEIKDICEETNTIIHYDGSHVLGLIAGGEFQDPLREGADILLGSTHKTFPGPQGAIIMGSNNALNKNPKIFKKIQKAIFPGLVSNHHLWRYPPLAVTLLEMLEFGKEYAHQVVLNARALAKSLDKYGFNVLARKFGYTDSHQILVNVKEIGGGEKCARILESANIICNKNTLFTDTDDDALQNPSGLRLGVQELTRIGMKEKDMEYIGNLFKRALIDGENPERIKADVINFRKKFERIFYSFDLEQS